MDTVEKNFVKEKVFLSVIVAVEILGHLLALPVRSHQVGNGIVEYLVLLY